MTYIFKNVSNYLKYIFQNVRQFLATVLIKLVDVSEFLHYSLLSGLYSPIAFLKMIVK